MKDFFIDETFVVTYDEFVNHVNSGSVYNGPYGKILSIIQQLTLGEKFSNIREIITYLKQNNHKPITIKTSGTTGEAKIIKQTLENVTRQVRETSESEVWAFAYNPEHFAGLQVLFQAIMNFNSIVYVFDKDFSKIPGMLEKHSVSRISCTPTFMKMLLPNVSDFDSLKSISFGGERLSEELVKKTKLVFPNIKIRNIYASSEAGSLLASSGEEFFIPKRHANVIKIINNELCIHNSLLGEFKMDEEWYHTGDMVILTNENKFIFDSRKSEIINIGGYRVSPSKVENFISSIKGVKDVVVYSRKNSLMGKILIAKIVCDGDSKTVKEKIKTTNYLLKYEKPLQIRFVDKLETTETGKVIRNEKNSSNG